MASKEETGAGTDKPPPPVTESPNPVEPTADRADLDGAESGPVDPLLTFRTGSMWFAVGAEAIDEICAVAEVTPLPLSPEHIPGVVSLRGQAVPLLDLKAFLGLGDEKPPEGRREMFARIAVASTAQMRVGIICDQVRGVLEIPRARRRRPEVTRGARLLEYVTHEVQRDEGMLLVLDLDKLLAAAKVQR
jgi:purine-binding chemotaxis protein CheW